MNIDSPEKAADFTEELGEVLDRHSAEGLTISDALNVLVGFVVEGVRAAGGDLGTASKLFTKLANQSREKRGRELH